MRCVHVWVAPVVTARVGVYDGTRETRYVVEWVVIHRLGDVVGSRDAEVAVHGDPNVRVQPVADPPNTEVTNFDDAVDRCDDVLSRVHKCGIDRVHQALTNAQCRLHQNGEGGGIEGGVAAGTGAVAVAGVSRR